MRRLMNTFVLGVSLTILIASGSARFAMAQEALTGWLNGPEDASMALVAEPTEWVGPSESGAAGEEQAAPARIFVDVMAEGAELVETPSGLRLVVQDEEAFLWRGALELFYTAVFEGEGEVARLEVTLADGEVIEREGEPEGWLALPLGPDAIPGETSLVARDAAGDVIGRPFVIEIVRAGEGPGVASCPPYQRHNGARCESCELGYQDPADPSACVRCSGLSELRWLVTSLDRPPAYHTHYVAGAAPECLCPPNAVGQEDGYGRIVSCQALCAADEVWISSSAECIPQRFFGAGGGLVDSDSDGLSDWTESQLGTDARDPDSDNDGLSDLDEWLAHTNPTNPDSDGDGLDDGEEKSKATDPWAADSDSDGLSDGVEVNTFGSDPLRQDSDGDSLGDCEETRATCAGIPAARFVSSDPTMADTDGDGLLDPFERTAGTNPRRADTDNDGIDDYTERLLGLNALHSGSGDVDGDGRTDNDADGDGLLDTNEVNRYGTNPALGDSDHDGLSDAAELSGVGPGGIYQTDATTYDSDGDGLGDGDEVNVHGTNPVRGDTDGDTLSDGDEVRIYGTNPKLRDSDNDGWTDDFELKHGKTDPNQKDTDGDGLLDSLDPDPTTHVSISDADGDGLGDLAERAWGTDPRKKDTDGDGLEDGREAYQTKTSPTMADTDHDGLNDGFELSLGLLPTDYDTDGDGPSDYEEYVNDGVARAKTRDKRDAVLPNYPRDPDDATQPAGYRAVIGQAFPGGLASIKPEYVRQGRVGNCWFVSAIAAAAAIRPQYVRDLIVDHHDGSYTVKFYTDTSLKTVRVSIDNRFPWNSKHHVTQFARAERIAVQRNVNGQTKTVQVPILWPLILEKAAAMHYNRNYDHLTGGLQHGTWGGMERILGQSTWWTFLLPDRKPTFERQLRYAQANHMPLVFSTGFVGPDRDTRCHSVVDWHVVAYKNRFRSNPTTGEREYELWNPHGFTYHMTAADIAHCYIGSGLGKRDLTRSYQDK